MVAPYITYLQHYTYDFNLAFEVRFLEQHK